MILTLLSLAPLLIAGQVLRIHLDRGPELRERGRQQASTKEALPALRGAILDRAGRVLATSTARYDLALDPEVDGFDDHKTLFFERLSKLTGRSPSGLRRAVRDRPSRRYVRLVRGLTEAEKAAVEGWDVPGVILERRETRRYNYGPTAAHLLGHVDADMRGIAGLEMLFDEHLRGVPGERLLKVDRHRNTKPFVGARTVTPEDGESLVLTIDLIRQTILEEELARGVEASGARWGTALAMDVHTGAILAMANVPTYDPNRPGAYATAARRNHAVTDRIEPGSTFKVVTALAALEAGKVRLSDSLDTGVGYARIAGRDMRDSRGYGQISFADALVKSSNIAAAKVALRLTPGDLYRAARDLGFGQRTWVDLPGEVDGLLKRPDRWSGTTQTAIAIGYEVDVTPLQLLVAYAAIANGGLLVRPYVVAERRDVQGRTVWAAGPDSVRRAFEPETAALLRPVLQRVVDEGTGTEAQVEGLPVAGKTGTARKAVGGGYGRDYRASFAGFFPADDPQVALVVVMDEPQAAYYGGSVAAPVFGRIAARWGPTFPALARRLAPPDSLPDPSAAVVPSVTGLAAAVAAERLRLAGLSVADVPESGAARPVVEQMPAVGTAALPRTHVHLELGEAAGPIETMPDVVGLSARHATMLLAAHGVEARIEGAGVVEAQVPAAGGALPDRAVLRCR